MTSLSCKRVRLNPYQPLSIQYVHDDVGIRLFLLDDKLYCCVNDLFVSNKCTSHGYFWTDCNGSLEVRKIAVSKKPGISGYSHAYQFICVIPQEYVYFYTFPDTMVNKQSYYNNSDPSETLCTSTNSTNSMTD
ncbi:MAG: hypothetical protein Sylvanvirus11_21 [Sylvanvirus sp.]|uniref:Uncharacterized protein n=1 Tax=Sylvanvirus sp. TaxID=2487774 RepID=A0A3G5AI73_9VIRU|nr:MAG: hypothetical protein Sylvanvirus11_21 [Sylvanvirus sp.]